MLVLLLINLCLGLAEASLWPSQIPCHLTCSHPSLQSIFLAHCFSQTTPLLAALRRLLCPIASNKLLQRCWTLPLPWYQHIPGCCCVIPPRVKLHLCHFQCMQRTSLYSLKRHSTSKPFLEGHLCFASVWDTNPQCVRNWWSKMLTSLSVTSYFLPVFESLPYFPSEFSGIMTTLSALIKRPSQWAETPGWGCSTDGATICSLAASPK